MKKKLSLFNRFFLLSLSGLLFTFICYGQATIDWSLSYPKAKDVNVGSGNPADIEIKFEVANAAMANAEMTIVFPNTQDIYDAVSHPAQNIGGSGAFIWNGINWTPGTRTLTFPVTNLPQNSTVWYKIPRKAIDGLPLSVTKGQVQIIIKDNGIILSDTTLSYNYNRAALSIINPTSYPPFSGQTGLTLDFASNNGAHNPGTNTDKEYRFGLLTSGGEIDSVRAKITIPTSAITLTPNSWQCNGIPVNRVSSTPSGSNTIYTLYLDKTHSIGSDGFGNGEVVNISLKAKKNFCGNTTVSMAAAWGSSGDYISATETNGSFAAAGGGTPVLVRSGTAPKASGMRNVDGVTANVMITKIKNTGSGDAANIIHTITTSTGEYSSFLDAGPVSYSVDGGTTWSTLTPTQKATRGSGSGANKVNTSYTAKPVRIEMTIPENLPAGQELWIEWNSYTAPDMFYNDTEVDRKWVRSVRHDDYTSYTDLCATATYNIQSASIHSLSDYMTGSNLGPSINLSANNPSVEAKMFSLAINARGSTLLFQNGSGYAEMRVVLPKGVKIQKTGATTYGVKIVNDAGTTVFNTTIASVDTADASLQNEYVFKINNITTTAVQYVFITLVRDCNQTGAVTGLYNADISFDLYPTGTVSSGANVKMPKVLQFYSMMSLSCSNTGLSYTLDIKRKTLGLIDTNNDGIPDVSLTKMHSGHPDYPKVDHKQMVTGDTTVLKFDGKIIGGSYPVLYAVVFSEENQSTYSILKDEVVVSGGSYTATLLNSVANGKVTPFSAGGAAPKVFAYVWKITKSGNFNTGDQIQLEVPFKSVSSTYAYQPSNLKLGSWFYASSSDLGTTVNFTSGTNPGNPGGARSGDEEYGFTTTYYRGNFGAWSQVTTLNFNGPATVMGGAYYNPLYHPAAAPAGWTPYEFRNVGTVDTLFVVVPEGYLISNTMRFAITGDANNGSNATLNSITADPTKSTKTRKAFIIRNSYETGSGDIYITTPGTNKIRISEGSYALQVRPDIIATPRAPQGTSNLSFVVYPNGTEYTQAYLPNASISKIYGSSTLIYSDANDIKVSTTDALTKNISQKKMNWSFKLENPSSSVANVIWLYVEGPVKNASFNGIAGQGEDNRWIKVTSLAGGADITGDLEFEVKPDIGCSDTKVTIYPIYQAGAPATWEPFSGTLTQAAFNASRLADGDDFDLYTYKEIVLTLKSVASQINGSITSWVNTPSDPENPASSPYGLAGVDKDQPFTVEVVFDASGSAAPVALASVEMDFPKGLEFHTNPDSVYIEYKGSVIKVTDATWIANLNTLIGDANPQNNVVFDLKNLCTTQSAQFVPLLGENATIDAGEKLYFRFKLRPTCDIALTGERIGARFSGKRFCDLSANATSNGQTVTSDQLTLLSPVLAFRSDLTFVVTKSSLVCESVIDSTNMMLTFKKLTKIAEPLQTSDSIKIELPLSMTLDGDIHYSFPAYNSIVSAESGTIPSSGIHSNVIGSVRYISWQLPISYYSALAASSASNQVKITYDWKVKTGKAGLQYNDTTRVKAVTRSGMSPHLSCPYTMVDADSIIKQIILIPAKIVTIPTGTGYIITDKYGKEITATDTVIYSGKEFQFNVKLLYGYTQSIPTVKANADTLASVGQGNYYFTYKFDVLVDTHITVDDVVLNKYTVYFDTQEGTKVKPYTGVVHGSTIPKPSVRPVRGDYTFRGWYSCNDTAYIEPWAFDIARVVNDTTIYAFWVEVPIPVITRSVRIPFAEGVTSNPDPGVYYVRSGEDYKFALRFLTPYPLKVTTGRVVDDKDEEIFGTMNANGQYEYVIRQVRSNILLAIGPDAASGNGTSNEVIDDASIWSYRNELFVTLNNEDIINIYSITGLLIRKIESGPGTVTIPLTQGVYIVTLTNTNLIKKVLIQ